MGAVKDRGDLQEAFPDLDCSPATGYCNSDWRGDRKTFEDWEREVAKPALEAAGYSEIAFHSIEKDSFGPLIRGLNASDANGKRVRFFYG